MYSEDNLLWIFKNNAVLYRMNINTNFQKQVWIISLFKKLYCVFSSYVCISFIIDEF